MKEVSIEMKERGWFGKKKEKFCGNTIAKLFKLVEFCMSKDYRDALNLYMEDKNAKAEVGEQFEEKKEDISAGINSLKSEIITVERERDFLYDRLIVLSVMFSNSDNDGMIRVFNELGLIKNIEK